MSYEYKGDIGLSQIIKDVRNKQIEEFLRKIDYILIKNYMMKETRYKYVYYEIQDDLLKLIKGLKLKEKRVE